MRKLGKGDTHEEKTVSKIPEDLGPSSTSLVNKEHAQELSNDGNDRTDSLVLEGIIGSDTYLLENRGTKVLNSTDTSHLSRSLDGTSDEKSAEARSISEKLSV